MVAAGARLDESADGQRLPARPPARQASQQRAAAPAAQHPSSAQQLAHQCAAPLLEDVEAGHDAGLLGGEGGSHGGVPGLHHVAGLQYSNAAV